MPWQSRICVLHPSHCILPGMCSTSMGWGAAVTSENENRGGAALGGLGTSYCNAILGYSTVRDIELLDTEWKPTPTSRESPFEKGLGKCLVLVWVDSGPCAT